jgi:hypothetical protein
METFHPGRRKGAIAATVRGIRCDEREATRAQGELVTNRLRFRTTAAHNGWYSLRSPDIAAKKPSETKFYRNLQWL